jgi:hypothetical protein
MNYVELTQELKQVAKKHKQEAIGLDPVWMCVKFANADWRKAKAAGAKKDSYHGWILFSTSTNSKGYELMQEIERISKAFDSSLSVSSLDL